MGTTWPSNEDIHMGDKDCGLSHHFSEVRAGACGKLSGYSGFHALDELRKEATLPPCAKK